MAARRSTVVGAPIKRESSCLRWVEPDKKVQREIVLYGECGDRLKLLVEEFAAVRDFIAAEVDAPTRMLFVGRSGTGKTLAVRWLGFHLNVPVAIIDVAAIVGSHLGETAKNLAEAMEAASSVESILFLDEIDGISQDRSMASTDAGREMGRATAAILQRLDWLPPTHLVIAATNLEEHVDSALRRRLHETVTFGPPPREIRKLMINRWLHKANVSEVARDELADRTEGCGGADIRQEAMALGRATILERRRSGNTAPLFGVAS